ncbi:EamA domain-containing membrane protein RarD [Cereibacter ovatus]|uniref:EamA domain-containing membrane protein RarD n=1 Tax=Cereibacter ovatus TaxID=439529 RepID=A0A285CYT6_9RHOB|nr:DMT family transporter [Cereibacter ovatus]SNX72710.1 EamA domain-containing membrane protein RarD [Cereibacter ovatus]
MTQPPDRILPGVALMIAFCILAPLLDVCAKLASATLPVGQITGARFLVQAVLMLPVVLVLRPDWRMSPRMAGLVAIRALFLILSTYSFVAAITVMPIADALAIAFVEPFILLILGRILFGDEVGPRRIGASLVGFGGALMVIQPSLAAFGLVALWPLGTAFFFAFYMLVTRQMSRGMHPVTMQLHTALAGVLMMLPVLLMAEALAIPTLDPVMPSGVAWLWLFGVGFWASASHICMTYALKFAPSATLAPLHYLEIVAAVGLGFAVFGDFPNPMTWAGIATIVASGLYIIHRERISARAARTSPAPAR